MTFSANQISFLTNPIENKLETRFDQFGTIFQKSLFFIFHELMFGSVLQGW